MAEWVGADMDGRCNRFLTLPAVCISCACSSQPPDGSCGSCCRGIGCIETLTGQGFISLAVVWQRSSRVAAVDLQAWNEAEAQIQRLSPLRPTIGHLVPLWILRGTELCSFVKEQQQNLTVVLEVQVSNGRSLKSVRDHDIGQKAVKRSSANRSSRSLVSVSRLTVEIRECRYYIALQRETIGQNGVEWLASLRCCPLKESDEMDGSCATGLAIDDEWPPYDATVVDTGGVQSAGPLASPRLGETRG